jgi:hypothetical protein
MLKENLEQQILRERAEIENAPVIQVASGTHSRCSFCGQLAKDLQYVENVHGIDRYKGECCRG